MKNMSEPINDNRHEIVVIEIILRYDKDERVLLHDKPEPIYASNGSENIVTNYKYCIEVTWMESSY